MIEMTIERFCEKHGACAGGRDWALANCKTMRGVWRKAKPEWALWIATRPGVLTDRELRLFACFCARQHWELLTDERSRNAVIVVERYAEGNATDDELAAAWAAAEAAAWAAARYAAEAAWAAAEAAAWAAAEAVRDAAWDAARYSAWAAAWYDAEAAGADQKRWLIANTKPNWQEGDDGE